MLRLWVLGIGIISVAALGATRPISAERRAAIKKLGLVVSFTEPRLSADLGDMSVTAGADRASEFPWVVVGTGGTYGGAAGSGIVGGIAAAVENARAGTRLGELLTAELGDWDFRNMIRNTVQEVLKVEANLTGVMVAEIPGGIKKSAASLSEQGIDTLVQFTFLTFGVQTEKMGLATKALAWTTIWDVVTGKILGSAWVEVAGGSKRSWQGKACPPDCAYAVPKTTTSLDALLADNARLLKQELKLAAYIATQQSVALSGLTEKPESVPASRYRERPPDWPPDAATAGEVVP